MQLSDFLHENKHHLTISLDPDQFKELAAMATANTAALTSIAASLATVAEAAVTALAAEPTGDTPATIAAVEAAVTSLTSTETALQAALTPAATSLTISPATLTDPVLNTPYSAQLSASGGSEPYTFSLAVGSELPPGLSLSSSGEINGTPTTSGSYSFVVDCIDATTPTTLDGSQSYSVTF
jgi:hypothetical protein